MKEPGLDIVVVNWQTADDLSGCLASILTYPPRGRYTVTIAQNEPLEADRKVAREFTEHCPWTEMVSETNDGYNVACNRAARHQPHPHEFIAFLNADTRTTAGAFDELCAALRSDPSWAIIGPRQTDSSGRLTAAGIFGPDENHAHRGWHQLDRGQFSDVRDDATYVAGSFLVMRRSVFNELTDCPQYRELVHQPGPWSDCRHYSGDKWLGVHARAHGHACVFYGPVQVFHEWHRSSSVGGLGEQHLAADEARYAQLCEAHDWPHN